MSVNSLITDPSNGLQARVVDGIEPHALVVATRPLKTYSNEVKFFFNDDYGVDMNINVSEGGTPLKVHDGTDSVLWTGTNLVGGKTVFNSADQNHTLAGSKSIKTEDANVNDIFELVTSSPVDMTGYASLSMWIYVDKDWKAGDDVEIYGHDSSTGLIVGDPVSLQNYFSYGSYDQWHKIIIPLADFGTLASYPTLDTLRITQSADERKAPKYYLDDIQFEETGSPVVFKILNDKSKWLHVEKMRLIIGADYDSRLEHSSVPNIDFESLLSLPSLAGGVIFRKVLEGVVKSSFTINKLSDALQIASAKVSEVLGTASNTLLVIDFDFIEPIILKGENNDFLSLTINDDLSELTLLRASVGIKVEVRS